MQQAIDESKVAQEKLANLQGALSQLSTQATQSLLLDLYTQSSLPLQEQIEDLLIAFLDKQMSSLSHVAVSETSPSQSDNDRIQHCLAKIRQTALPEDITLSAIWSLLTEYLEEINMLCLLEAHQETAELTVAFLAQFEEIWSVFSEQQVTPPEHFLQLFQVFLVNCWISILKNEQPLGSKVETFETLLNIAPNWYLPALISPLAAIQQGIDDVATMPQWSDFISAWFQQLLERVYAKRLFNHSTLGSATHFKYFRWFFEVLFIHHGEEELVKIIKGTKAIIAIQYWQENALQQQRWYQAYTNYQWIIKLLPKHPAELLATCYDGMVYCLEQQKKPFAADAKKAFIKDPSLDRFLRWYAADGPTPKQQANRLEQALAAFPERSTHPVKGLLLCLQNEPLTAAGLLRRQVAADWQNYDGSIHLLLLTIIWTIQPELRPTDDTSASLLRYFYGNQFDVDEAYPYPDLLCQMATMFPNQSYPLPTHHWFDVLQACPAFPVADKVLAQKIVVELRRVVSKRLNYLARRPNQEAVGVKLVMLLQLMKQAEAPVFAEERTLDWIELMLANVCPNGPLMQEAARQLGFPKERIEQILKYHQEQLDE